MMMMMKRFCKFGFGRANQLQRYGCLVSNGQQVEMSKYVRHFRASSKLLENLVVKVPPMGEAVTQGDLVEWLKKPGDQVNQDDVICVLETDKVTVDIRTPQAGVLAKQLANAEETVHTDQPIAEIEVGAVASSSGSSSQAAAPKEEAKAEQPAAESTAEAPTELHLAPPREPLIKFRYGKANEDNATPAAGSLELTETDTSKQADDGYIPSPPIYGRLDPLSDEDALRLELGLPIEDGIQEEALKI